jgi:hypothetical protein
MEMNYKPLLVSVLIVLAVAFCTIAGILYVRHTKLAAKKEGMTITLRPAGSDKAAVKSKPLHEVNDEELVAFRRRLERKAWEAAKAKELEAAKREGREPVQIIAGSDIPAILKYYEEQDAAKTAAEAEGAAEISPAAPAEKACSRIDTASAESLTRSLGGSAWKFSSPAWRDVRLEFYEDGGYITGAGRIGRWTVPAAGRIVMTNSDEVYSFTVTVSADGKGFNGERNDGLAVFAALICE